ncbi:MAG: hypothetical protein ACW976_04735 [Candidatus Ranarchaeia archaeon]|jgi:hypothetical protein
MENPDNNVPQKKKKAPSSDTITRADHYVVKLLIGGLLLSMMILMGGGLVFLITLLLPTIGWEWFFGLNIGLQIMIVGGAFFGLFGLFILFNIIWKLGYSTLIRVFHGDRLRKSEKLNK